MELMFIEINITPMSKDVNRETGLSGKYKES